MQEHPAIGSDGESEEASATSDDIASSHVTVSPGGSTASSGGHVHVRMRQKPTRKWSEVLKLGFFSH